MAQANAADETDSIEQAITQFDTPKESIMNLQDTLFSAVIAGVAALSLSVAAHAAPQEVVKLERVVVHGKAVRDQAPVIAQLPRVVVTGYAQREVAQLPRVVIVGTSEATQLRNTTLAAAKTTTQRI
jgi:hypothetical protein